MKWEQLLPPLYRWKNWGSERLNNFPKVTQLGSDFPESYSHACVPRAWLLNSYAKPSCQRLAPAFLPVGLEMMKWKVCGKVPRTEQMEAELRKPGAIKTNPPVFAFEKASRSPFSAKGRKADGGRDAWGCLVSPASLSCPPLGLQNPEMQSSTNPNLKKAPGRWVTRSRASLCPAREGCPWTWVLPGSLIPHTWTPGEGLSERQQRNGHHVLCFPPVAH